MSTWAKALIFSLLLHGVMIWAAGRFITFAGNGTAVDEADVVMIDLAEIQQPDDAVIPDIRSVQQSADPDVTTAEQQPDKLQQTHPQSADPQLSKVPSVVSDQKNPVANEQLRRLQLLLAKRNSHTIKPVAIKNETKLKYPHQAAEQHQGGTVMVLMEIAPSGKPNAMAVTQKCGIAELDQEAASALRQWQFVAAIDTVTGQTVSSVVLFKIDFSPSGQIIVERLI